MKYKEELNIINKTHICPFCHEKKENMLYIGRYFFVIPARAPYSKHHILIVPKRHVNILSTLTHAELLEMHKLIDIRAKKLHKKYKDISLLLRDGLVKDPLINKSVNHLHFHLIPNVGVYIQSQTKAENRTWMGDMTYTKTAQTYKKTFL